MKTGREAETVEERVLARLREARGDPEPELGLNGIVEQSYMTALETQVKRLHRANRLLKLKVAGLEASKVKICIPDCSGCPQYACMHACMQVPGLPWPLNGVWRACASGK